MLFRAIKFLKFDKCFLCLQPRIFHFVSDILNYFLKYLWIFRDIFDSIKDIFNGHQYFMRF